MFINYKAPVAEVVCVEAVDIITASTGEVDTPENLNTWGKGIGEFASTKVNVFG